MATIYEVLELGPIMACNEELGLLVTVNGSYFNLHVGSQEHGWTNTDCRYLDNCSKGLYGLEIVPLMERAEKYLEEVIIQEDEDENNDDIIGEEVNEV